MRLDTNGLKLQLCLGDGAYVGVDVDHVWIYTSNGVDVTNQVAMAPFVLNAFKHWAKRAEHHFAHTESFDDLPDFL